MMAPVFVKPYLKSNKNDRNDAKAICKAVQRPSMRFVSVKTPEQQAILHLYHGRQLAAYLGLVPRQASSGGKERLLGISKRGDGYLRGLLIHSARAVLHQVQRRLQAGKPGDNPWAEQLLQRCRVNKAAVALANKMTRMALGRGDTT